MVQLSSTTSVMLFGVALFIVGCAAGAGLMVILQTFQKSKAAEKARREAIELNNIRRTRRGGGGDQDIDIERLARPAPTRTRTRQQQPTIPTRPRAPLSERLNGIELVEVDLRGDERRQRRR
ncbi:hypothetical protein V8F06_003574 [Rhypophila decipiens]